MTPSNTNTHTHTDFVPKWLSAPGFRSSTGCSLLVHPPVRGEKGELKMVLSTVERPELNRFKPSTFVSCSKVREVWIYIEANRG